jgi:hypothetical protein
MQICKYNTPHKQNQAQKQPVQLNWCRKDVWQNSISLHDKNLEEPRNRSIPQHNKGSSQHNKGYIWQTCS